jgi:starch synthase
VMKTSDAAGFAEALKRAQQAFRKPAEWRRIQLNGLGRQFGWDASAQRYLEVYERAIALART